jgi:hypothetical protein
MRELLPAVVSLVVIVSTPAFGQGFVPLPNQLSLGIGAVRDRQPPQSASTIALSFAFADSGNDYWPSRFGLVWEAEVWFDERPRRLSGPRGVEREIHRTVRTQRY